MGRSSLVIYLSGCPWQPILNINPYTNTSIPRSVHTYGVYLISLIPTTFLWLDATLHLFFNTSTLDMAKVFESKFPYKSFMTISCKSLRDRIRHHIFCWTILQFCHLHLQLLLNEVVLHIIVFCAWMVCWVLCKWHSPLIVTHNCCSILLHATNMLPWLLDIVVVTSSCMQPTSAINSLNQMASFVLWLVVMYSASTMDATVVCWRLLFHYIAPNPTLNM